MRPGRVAIHDFTIITSSLRYLHRVLALQLGLSFAVWIGCGLFVARRPPRAGGSSVARTGASALGALLFILSAVVLVGGLLWVSQTSGPVKAGLSGGSWLAVTGLGALFTVGQTEAARLVLASIASRREVTEEASEPSGSSSL